MGTDLAPQIIRHYPTFGCDPEFFFERDNRIIGSEKVLDDAGLHFEGQLMYARGDGTFICDGVQVELNPAPQPCRANVGNEIALAFRTLRRHLQQTNNISTNFSAVIEVPTDELASLSEKSRVLGCAPSENLYDKHASISVDAATYRTRSAGGHIHLGFEPWMHPFGDRLVRLMDVLVGNTCVLIDRDPLAAKRREVYGRAGEHRHPRHGIEYRTLSNFWLKDYKLVSFIMGLARLATSVLYTTLNPTPCQPDPGLRNYHPYKAWDAETELLRYIDDTSIQTAINENNLAKAQKNFAGVSVFLQKHVVYVIDCGLHARNLDDFAFFASKVQEHGLDFWFPGDPLDNWCALPDGHGRGWESFLYSEVKNRRLPITE